MKSLKKLAYIADKFEHKLSKRAEDPQTSQNMDTQTLFFGVGNALKDFLNNVHRSDGVMTPFKQFMVDKATKLQKSVSLDMTANATKGKGAAWSIAINPPEAKQEILSRLNTEFQKVTNMSLPQAQAKADQGAKAGNGTGPNKIFEFNVDM